jgi:dual specificity protein phosphatase-like protein
MDLFQVDDHGRLYISPAIEEWSPVAEYGIDVVIDLEGGLDACIPTVPNQCLYIYFPILDDDEELPNLGKLGAVARLGASLIERGHRVLSHCGMGFNRSALMAGLILTELGMSGAQAVARLRERRPGALYNERFASFVEMYATRKIGV